MRESYRAISSFESRKQAFSVLHARVARVEVRDLLPDNGDYNDNEMVPAAVMTDNKVPQKCNSWK